MSANDPTGVLAGEPDHGPLAASLSERTLDKVLSRPAHIPSIVMLDRDAAAQHMADTIEELHGDVHQCRGFWYNPLRKPGAASAKQGPCPTLQAVADYRETTR